MQQGSQKKTPPAQRCLCPAASLVPAPSLQCGPTRNSFQTKLRVGRQSKHLGRPVSPALITQFRPCSTSKPHHQDYSAMAEE